MQPLGGERQCSYRSERKLSTLQEQRQLICSWYFWPGKSKSRGYSQEDMIAFGLSARHWQQIEAGRPITMTTLLRICDAFKVRIAIVVRGTDRKIYRDYGI